MNYIWQNLIIDNLWVIGFVVGFILFILFIRILVFFFYWYGYRPSHIKKEYYSIALKKATEKANPQEQRDWSGFPSHEEIVQGLGKQTTVLQNSGKYYRNDYDSYYKMCLQKMGL